MKSILLIGLGRFGKNIAMNLSQLGCQVLAVDHVEERVNEVLPYVTSAQIGDSTNEPGTYRRSFCCATAPTRWSIRKSSWPSGRPSGAAPTTSWTIWSWTRSTPCSR